MSCRYCDNGDPIINKGPHSDFKWHDVKGLPEPCLGNTMPEGSVLFRPVHELILELSQEVFHLRKQRTGLQRTLNSEVDRRRARRDRSISGAACSHPQISAFDQEAEVRGPGWLCPHCTWVNQYVREKCRHCGKPNPFPKPEKPEAYFGPELGTQPIVGDGQVPCDEDT